MKLTSHPIAQCPVTGGCATIMSQEDFDYKCEYRRNRQKVKGHYSHKYCQVCDRKPPQELTIKDIEQKEDTMNKEVKGKCEQCGKGANLRSVTGKSVYPSCGVVRGSVKNRPEIVKVVMKEFGHSSTRLESNSDDQLVLAKIKVALRAEDSVPDIGLPDLVKDLSSSLDNLADKYNRSEKIILLKTERIEELKKKKDLLHKELLARASKIEKLNMLLSQASHEYTKAEHSPMDKLAIGIMNKTIIGISDDLYRELQGLN